MDATDREFIKHFGNDNADAPPLDSVDKKFIEQNAPTAQAAETANDHKGVWAPDVPIQSADEPFYLLGAELGLPYLAGRGLLAASARAGIPAAGKFLTGQVGKNLLSRLPSLATSGAWQGALSEGVDKLAGYGHDLGVGGSAAVGAGVNALTGAVAAPFINRIAPEVARRAQRFMAQGIPLRTYQIPGASAAASTAGRLKAYAKLLGMGDKEAPAFTESLMKTTGSNAKLLNPDTLAQARDDIKDRLASAVHPAWSNVPHDQMPKMLDKALNTPGALSPAQATTVRLEQNRWINANVLDRVEANSKNAAGYADPKAVLSAVRSNAAKYPGGFNASQSAAFSGNSIDLGTLAEGGHFAPQPIGMGKLAAGAVTGGGLLGFGELEGLPLIEKLGQHPLTTTGALAAIGAIGGAQNTHAYTNWLLGRAARGASPLLAGSNPLIPGYLAARGDNVDLSELNPVSSAQGAEYEPSDLAPHISAASAKYDMDPALLTRQIRQESGFKNLPPNKAGAMGVSQFTADTAHDYGIDPMDPAQSVMGQAHYMSDLRKRFGNDGLALAAYNWGPGNLAKWLDKGGAVPRETSDYVKNITGRELPDWAGNGHTPLINVYRSPDTSEAASNAFFGSGSGNDAGNVLAGSQ